MSDTNLITILGNLSQSLAPVQQLVSGGAYVLGILFVLKALGKYRNIGDHRAQSSSQEKMLSPTTYLFFGILLIYLPTGMHILANTAFGSGNVLTYSPLPGNTIYTSMGIIIRMAGLIWFIRGCVIVAQAGEPGAQKGVKGLLFIIAGIFAMNFDNTIAMLNYTLNQLLTMTLAVKSSQGY